MNRLCYCWVVSNHRCHVEEVFMCFQPNTGTMGSDGEQSRVDRAFQAYEDGRGEDARREVAELLAHEDATVREAALQRLAECAVDPAAVEPVLSTVVSRATDPEPRVRDAARTVFHRLAGACVERDESLPGLDELLAADDATVRRDALHAAKMAGERGPSALTSHASTFADLLSDDDLEIRHEAALVLEIVVDDSPAAVARVTPRLVDRLDDDDALVKDAVVRTLAAVSAHRPRVVVDAIRSVESELEAGVVDRDPMIELVANVADVAPWSVQDLTSELVDVATAPPEEVRHGDGTTLQTAARQNDRRLRRESTRADALRALSSIAGHDPDVVVPWTEAVASLLDADAPEVRTRTLTLLRTLGIERPRAMDAAVPALVEHVAEAPRADERTRAGELLVEFGDVSTPVFARTLERHVDEVLDLLSHEDAAVRATATGLLSFVAERDPSIVASNEETLIALLDDDPRVRGNAALVLGLGGSEDARDALLSLDPEEEFVEEAVVRALARLE